MKSFFFILVFLACCNASFAEIYKWVDSSGKIHYTDKPPAGHNRQTQPEPLAFSEPVNAPSADNEIRRNRPTIEEIEEQMRLYQNLNLKSVPTNGASQQSLYALFKQITNACSSKQRNAYFALLSVREKVAMLRRPVNDQEKAFSHYCDFASKANIAIGGKPEGGLHTVEQQKKRFKNPGVNISYWYIKTQQGQLVFRLKIVFENGQLKIDDH